MLERLTYYGLHVSWRWAAAVISTMSRRAVGSPPERWTWSTPIGERVSRVSRGQRYLARIAGSA